MVLVSLSLSLSVACSLSFHKCLADAHVCSGFKFIACVFAKNPRTRPKNIPVADMFRCRCINAKLKFHPSIPIVGEAKSVRLPADDWNNRLSVYYNLEPIPAAGETRTTTWIGYRSNSKHM